MKCDYGKEIRKSSKSGPIAMKTSYGTKIYHAVLSSGGLALFRSDRKYDDLEGCKIVFKNDQKRSIQIISKHNHDKTFWIIQKEDIDCQKKFEVIVLRNNTLY